MPSISTSVRLLGGIAATHELLSAGHAPAAIFSAMRAGDVIRVRKGWYANADLASDILQAWRVGGQLACVSAARQYGLWVPELPGLLHISVRPNAAQLRTPENHRVRLAHVSDEITRIHWTREASGDRVAVSVNAAIEQIFKCQPANVGFVVLESALHLRRVDACGVEGILERVSLSARAIARRAGPNSESGSESLLKLLLIERGIPYQQQVDIPRVGRVDFLIGDRLVVEVDSKQHHSDPYRDRKRDAALSVEGMRVLRFMYSQIVYERAQVEAAIVSALARSDHNRA
jgi:very-short-patch-repair endonuclease